MKKSKRGLLPLPATSHKKGVIQEAKGSPLPAPETKKGPAPKAEKVSPSPPKSQEGPVPEAGETEAGDFPLEAPKGSPCPRMRKGALEAVPGSRAGRKAGEIRMCLPAEARESLERHIGSGGYRGFLCEVAARLDDGDLEYSKGKLRLKDALMYRELKRIVELSGGELDKFIDDLACRIIGGDLELRRGYLAGCNAGYDEDELDRHKDALEGLRNKSK